MKLTQPQTQSIFKRLAMLTLTTLLTAASAAHALRPPQQTQGKPASGISTLSGACTQSHNYPQAVDFKIQTPARSLWRFFLTTPPISYNVEAWAGQSYKTIANSSDIEPIKLTPYDAPAWVNSPSTASLSSNPAIYTLPPCAPPSVPTGYARVDYRQPGRSSDLFYLDQRIGAASKAFISPALGWGVDENGVYLRGALVLGSEQFCKLVAGRCMRKLDAATITATAQSIAQQVLEQRFEVVHVLGHQIWVQAPQPSDVGRRGESAAEIFASRVAQLYRGPSSAASSAMSRASGRIVVPNGQLHWHPADRQSFYVGDAGLYYQDRLIEAGETTRNGARNDGKVEWRLVLSPTHLVAGIATQKAVFLFGNSGHGVADVDAASLTLLDSGYSKDAQRVYYGASALQGVPSGALASEFQLKHLGSVIKVGFFPKHPDLFWIAGVPHSEPNGAARLGPLHAVQGFFNVGELVYDVQGVRYARADVAPYACGKLAIQANPPNGFVKATRAGAEPEFYSHQGSRITHLADVRAIQTALSSGAAGENCWRTD